MSSCKKENLGVTAAAPPAKLNKTSKHRERLGEGNTGSVKLAKRIREAEEEPIKCASPPCYLSEIED